MRPVIVLIGIWKRVFSSEIKLKWCNTFINIMLNDVYIGGKENDVSPLGIDISIPCQYIFLNPEPSV